MRTRRRPLIAAVTAAGLLLVGCGSEDPVSPDPDGLEAPGDDPEGADRDGLGEQEPGTGEPAIEGDTEGRFDPGDEDEEE